MRHSRRGPGRRGFTVIELLVVIAIIAVLLSLSVAAVMKFRGTGQRNATQTTLSSAQTKLNTQWSTVRDQARTNQKELDAYRSALMTAYGISDSSDTTAIQQAYVSAKLKQVFPSSFAEALNPAPLPPLPQYKTYLTGLGFTTGGTAATAPYESSICVLMALEKGPGSTGVSQDDFGAAGVTTFTQVGATARGLCDGWGNPIKFTRTGTPPAPSLTATTPDGMTVTP